MEENNKSYINNIDEIDEIDVKEENKFLSFFNKIKGFFSRIFKTNKQLALPDGIEHTEDNGSTKNTEDDTQRSKFVASIKIQDFEKIRQYEEYSQDYNFSFDIEIKTKEENEMEKENNTKDENKIENETSDEEMEIC